jgi:hypothetical protein
MIWAGIAAGGFGFAELVEDRSAEAALAADTASAAAANATSSFNLTVMGESLGAGGNAVWSRARGIAFKTAIGIAIAKGLPGYGLFESAALAGLGFEYENILRARRLDQ